jgi:hypothetical protein
MNSKQMQVAQTVTTRKWIDWKTCQYIAGEMAFSMTEIGDTVFIHGSNTASTEWWQKQVIVQVFIGPRGGIKKFAVL